MKNDKKEEMQEATAKPMHYPSILKIDEGDLPSVVNWKVGKTYTLQVTAKLTSSKQNDPMLMSMGDTDSEKVHCEMEVEDVKEIKQNDSYKQKAIGEAISRYSKSK